MDLDLIAKGFKMILEGLGEDPNRDGLLETPERVARMYSEMLGGLEINPNDFLNKQFDEVFDEMVLVRDIAFTSMCEHHFLPFIGRAHVAYIPKEKIVGLSKLARVVDAFARRPQVQERLTFQIADFIEEKIEPLGVAVVLESEHSCMTMRGIKKPGAKMLTSQMRGVFKTNKTTRSEFMHLIHQHG